MEFNNLFQQSCLIQISASVWQGSRMLENGLMQRIGQSEWLRGRKYLINQELLTPIRSCVSQAREMVLKYALPFPINSIYLVPKEQLTYIDGKLQHYQMEFNQKVSEFLGIYEPAREEARIILGELFNELDYPEDISSKFKLEWRFLVLDVPERLSVLPPEVYEQEKQKFVQLLDDTRELCVSALREEFAGIVTHMVERLSTNNGDKPKIFKSSMIDKMTEFLENFHYRNLFKDEQLSDLVETAEALVSGISPEQLRDDSTLRRRVASGMRLVKAAVDESIEDLPRRKLRLAA